MGARASINVDALPVVPGERATCDLRIQNAGSVVDEFTFEVLGEAAPWTTLDPPMVRLMPGTDQVVKIVLAPPATPDVRPGPTPVGIKVISREDPLGTAVVETMAEVGTTSNLGAELIPRTSRGSRRGRHELAVDNRGNEATEVTVEGRDPDQKVTFEIKRSPITIGAGHAEFTALSVKPEKTFWRGSNKTLPFTLEVASADGQTTTVDGSYVQYPLLPPWSLRALAFVLAGLLLLLIAWFAFLKPTVETAAKEAAEEVATEAAQEAIAASGGGGGGGGAPPDPGGGGGDDGGGDDGEELSGPRPFAERVEVTGVAPTASQNVASTGLAEDERFVLTDVIFSNPTGDSGTVRLKRGDETIYELSMANFRDLDFHFVTPVVFDGQDNKPSLEIQGCDPGADGTCHASVLLTGNVFTVES